MTIEKMEFNVFEVRCDDCPFEEEYADNTWQEMLSQIYVDGWRTRREGDDWLHRCPSCVQDAAENAAKAKKCSGGT